MSILSISRGSLFALCTLSLILIAIATDMISATDANQVSLADYQAPLRNEGNPNNIPEWYIIELRPGHTMEQHSKAVGTDMKQYLKISLDRAWGDRVVYLGININDELLDRIRKDFGVREVRCDTMIIMEEE